MSNSGSGTLSTLSPPRHAERLPQTGYALASPALRAAAWACDGLLFALPTLAVAWSVGGHRLYGITSTLLLHKSVPRMDLGPFAPHRSTLTPSAQHLALQVAVIALVFLVAVALWVLYRIGCTAWRGATIGKWAWGIRVVRVEDIGRPPSLRRSFTRWMVPQAAGLLPLPGTGIVPYLLLVRDRQRQGAHDKAARTLVIRQRQPFPPARVTCSGPGSAQALSQFSSPVPCPSPAPSPSQPVGRASSDSRVPGFV